MAKPKSPADQVLTWLRGNKLNLGAMTGTDVRALQAAVQIIELYSIHREFEVLEAFGAIVRCGMQPSCQRFAFHAIAMVLDWSDRLPVWQAAGLPELINVGTCEFEPRATAVAC